MFIIRAFVPSYFCVRYINTNQKTIYKVLQYLVAKHDTLSVKENVKKLMDLVPQGGMYDSSYKRKFKEIDMTWCSHVKSLDPNDILLLLNVWSMRQHRTIVSSLFYQVFVQKVKNGLWKQASWDQLVQITYFLSYMKNHQNTKSLIILCLHKVNERNELQNADYRDICIIAEASFKTSTIVPLSPFITAAKEILHCRFQELLTNPEWLVMLIKVLRISKHYDSELLLGMSQSMIKSKLTGALNFTALTYIISFYADAKVRDEELVKCLSSLALDNMQKLSSTNQSKSAHFSVAIRAKDVNTFLWALSMLCCDLTKCEVEDLIIPFFVKKLLKREFEHSEEIIVQSLLSLWMMGYFSEYLFKEIVNEQTTGKLQAKENGFRDLSRYALLLECYEKESPFSLSHDQLQVIESVKSLKLFRPKLEKELTKRTGLQRLQTIINDAAVPCGVNRHSFDYIVPHLYILGLSVWTSNGKIHIDVLDNSVCFQNSEKLTPSGMLALKIRLLPKIEEKTTHFIVSEGDFNTVKEKSEAVDYLMALFHKCEKLK